MGNPWDNDPVVPGTGPAAAQPAPAAAAPQASAATPWANDPVVAGTGPSQPPAPQGTVAGAGGRGLLEGSAMLGDIPLHLVHATDMLGKMIADHIRGALGFGPSGPTGKIPGEGALSAAAPAAADSLGLNKPTTPGQAIAYGAGYAAPAAAAALAAPETAPALASGAARVAATVPTIAKGALQGAGIAAGGYAVKHVLGEEAGEKAQHLVEHLDELTGH